VTKIDLGIGALVGIAIASLIAAILALLVVRRWSDQDAIAKTKAQTRAHLFELRLFIDDPAQILRSQRALVLDQARVVRLLLPSFVILAFPMAGLMWMLDGLYGRAPLRVGEPAVVLAESRHESITAPHDVIVETKPLYIETTGETGWRIRPARPVTGTIEVAAMRAKIVAGTGIAYLPEPLPGTGRIRIQYPSATVFGFHWLLWFLLLSTIAALAFRRVLRVVF
jgi:hypothetical protein